MDASGFTADVKSWSDVLANVVQVVAIAIGGWWAYAKFIRQREEWPRATLEQAIARRKLSASQTLLRVSVGVKNAGTVLIDITDIRVYIYQVLPLTDDTTKTLEGGDLVADGAIEATWPCLHSRVKEWEPHEACIEPDESDQFGFDFVVPGNTETVFVYCYVRNVRHLDRDIGWSLSQFYDLDDDSPQPERGESLTGKAAVR